MGSLFIQHIIQVMETFRTCRVPTERAFNKDPWEFRGASGPDKYARLDCVRTCMSCPHMTGGGGEVGVYPVSG